MSYVQASRLSRDRPTVAVIYSSSVDGEARRIADDVRHAGHGTLVYRFHRTIIQDVAADDPDVVLLVRSADSFDPTRVCADLHDAVRCRVLVVDFAAEPTTEDLVVRALEAGADDYMDGRIATKLLLAKIHVALRSRRPPAREVAPIEIGDLFIDLEAHLVHLGGVEVNCPPRLFDVLVALASRPNQVVLRDTLICDVWRLSPDPSNFHRVRVAISLLRSLIGSGPRRPTIESVSRVGYRLVPPAGNAA